MANIAKLTELLMMRVSPANPRAYRIAVEYAIEMAFSELVELCDFPFLKSRDRVKIDLVVGSTDYEISKPIGRILRIENGAGREIIKFRDGTDFDEALTSDATNNSTEQTGTPTIFKIDGLGPGGNLWIKVFPTPSENLTVYLAFNVPGTLANVGYLPDAFNPVLYHRVMSLLAPPEERKRTPDGLSWWKAVTKDEYLLSQAVLERLMVNYKIAKPDRYKPPPMDPYIQAQLEDIDAV